jgi:hypothetical protein
MPNIEGGEKSFYLFTRLIVSLYFIIYKWTNQYEIKNKIW